MEEKGANINCTINKFKENRRIEGTIRKLGIAANGIISATTKVNQQEHAASRDCASTAKNLDSPPSFNGSSTSTSNHELREEQLQLVS